MPNQLYSNGYLQPKRPGRTTFDLSHERILTGNMGQLIPILSEMAYPGDHFRISTRCVVRFNPLIHPVMHRVTGTVHYFAVPIRLLYPKDFPDDTDSRIRPFSFEECIMGGADGVDDGVDDNFDNIRFFLRGTTNATSSTGPDQLPGLWVTSDYGHSDPAVNSGSLWDFFRNAPSRGGEAGSPSNWRALRLRTEEQVTPDDPDSNIWTSNAYPITAPWLAYHFIWWENYRDPFIKANPVAGYDPPFVSAYNSQLWTPLLTDFAYKDIDSVCHPDQPFNPLSVSDIRRPKYRAYEKDYFTSAQIQAQRGPAGIVSTGDVIGGIYNIMVTDGDNTARVFAGSDANSANMANIYPDMMSIFLAADRATLSGGALGTSTNSNRASAVSGASDDPPTQYFVPFDASPATGNQQGTYPGSMYVNLPSATNHFDINTLILAYAMQHHANVNQRFGNRFTDYIYGHFDVRVKDERLQRPEYIGGMSFPVVFSEVLQTSSSTPGENALGELGGHGMAVNGSQCASYYVTDYCIIMGILNVQPSAVYGQGIDRQWLKDSRYDFFTPDFAFIGEQGVLNEEIYAQTPVDSSGQPVFPLIGPESIFGYQGAFDHYRQRTSSYHGLMHTGLASWHFGRFFDSPPILDTEFITTSTDDWERCFAVTSEVSDELVMTVGQQIYATRPMPYVSVPHIDGMED